MRRPTPTERGSLDAALRRHGCRGAARGSGRGPSPGRDEVRDRAHPPGPATDGGSGHRDRDRRPSATDRARRPHRSGRPLRAAPGGRRPAGAGPPVYAGARGRVPPGRAAVHREVAAAGAEQAAAAGPEAGHQRAVADRAGVGHRVGTRPRRTGRRAGRRPPAGAGHDGAGRCAGAGLADRSPRRGSPAAARSRARPGWSAVTATTEALTEAVHAAMRPVARRGIGLAAGAFVGSQTVVHTTGPVSGDSLFQIGSVTKLFTALALADAVARGDLTLDTPLAALLPETPTSRTGVPITLDHLATHTSGLPRLPPGLLRRALRSRADPYRDVTTDFLLGALAATRLRSEPGA